MTGVIIKRGDTQEEDSHVMMGAEIGVVYLQTKECQRVPVPPETGRGKE